MVVILATLAARSFDMRICKGVFIGFLFLAFTIPAWAADVVKLGFFDKQAIVDRSDFGKRGEESFKIEMKKVREKLEAERQEIKELEEEIKKKEVIWSDDVKKAKLQEFFGKKRNLEQLVVQANRELERREQELLKPLKETLIKVVTQIGKEEGFTMIFERDDAGLFYAPNSLDLTDRIIRELNVIAAKEAGKQ
jgi:outer membrane protein